MAKNNCGCGSCGCGKEKTTTPGSVHAGYTRVDSVWRAEDIIGAVSARVGINRNNYRVSPGLYALGSPGKESEVFVTANYKYTFDILRHALSGLDAWILVLDTKGINVWCAAGKGSFGTIELMTMIKETNLENAVSHRRLILPQLGAPGVVGFEIKKYMGFEVVYGPVRAEDIKKFFENGMKADEEMRRVRFNALDRAQLTFVELGSAMKTALIAVLAVVIVSAVKNGINIEALMKAVPDTLGVLCAVFAGAVLTPLFLPWLPFRSFSLKGFFVGLICGGSFAAASGFAPLLGVGWMLMIAAVSSFLGMGFTGASTYTSFSGTIKEMTYGLPLQAVFALAGVSAYLIYRLTSGGY